MAHRPDLPLDPGGRVFVQAGVPAVVALRGFLPEAQVSAFATDLIQVERVSLEADLPLTDPCFLAQKVSSLTSGDPATPLISTSLAGDSGKF